MRVKVDISGVIEQEKRANAGLRRVPKILERDVDRGAKRAARRHPYQNRTHKLTDETKAVVEEFDDMEATVSLVADTPYAEYVRRRGLMTIDEQRILVERALEREFANLADDIAD